MQILDGFGPDRRRIEPSATLWPWRRPLPAPPLAPYQHAYDICRGYEEPPAAPPPGPAGDAAADPFPPAE